MNLPLQIETEANKMKDIVRKNADPKLVEKYDELEKEFKKQINDAKVIFDDKVGKPLNEKVDVKKITETILKSTKELEVSLQCLQIKQNICYNHNYNLANT